MSFRTTATPFAVFQTVWELISIARESSPTTRARILNQMPVAAGVVDLDRLINEQHGRLREDQLDTIYPPLLLAAVLPNDDYDAFVTATALLLADKLQDGAGTDSLSDHWDAVSAYYAAAPRPVAAALRRGYVQCQVLGLASLGTLPEDDEMATTQRSTTLKGLRDLARSMKPEDLHLVASRGSTGSFQAHRAAIRALLASSNCLLPDDGRPVPGDVIDLMSNFPGPGFAQTTALILIEAIHCGDALGQAAHRWVSVARHYDPLPPQDRSAILTGYRHLWESHPSWTPYKTWTPAHLRSRAVAIPFGQARVS